MNPGGTPKTPVKPASWFFIMIGAPEKGRERA
jgi:hypothetical protein